jgi:uncharacterized surface protein with fasciclin (FAS1) repeats
MEKLKRIVALLTLFAIVLAFAAPALAQSQSMPMASPTMMPGRPQPRMMPMEQSDKDLMATLADTKDTSIPASFMKTAGLESMTMPGGKYTLFVASDTALKAMSPDMKNQVMKKLKDKQMGAEFVKGHMINDIVTPDEMTDGKTLTMMNGMTMKVGRTDGRMTVDDATIVKAFKTSNGMIYVMDRIPSSIGGMMEQMGMLPMSSTTASR